MTLTIELPDEIGTALKAQAQTQGVSAEQYARQVLAHEIASSNRPIRHISEKIRNNMRDMPPDVLASLPRDGASEHDHYIYGFPKRNS